jgi:hypothetical protein
MRKFIVTILAAVYLVASTGASVSIHYCMGKLVDWTLDNDQKIHCSYCGMAKNGSAEGCCKDDQKFVKNTDDQKTAATVELIILSSASLPSSFIDKPEHLFSSLTEGSPNANAPPRTSSVPVYLSNCVFLI